MCKQRPGKPDRVRGWGEALMHTTEKGEEEEEREWAEEGVGFRREGRKIKGKWVKGGGNGDTGEE